MLSVEDWAEIRRLHKADGMPIKVIARTVGCSKNTVKKALSASGPPSYSPAPSGSVVDVVEPLIREYLQGAEHAGDGDRRTDRLGALDPGGSYWGYLRGSHRSQPEARASASRRRAQRVLRRRRATSGSSSTTASKSWWGIAITFRASSAVTFADRGRPSIMLISPK